MIDGLNAAAVADAVERAEPDAIVHQMAVTVGWLSSITVTASRDGLAVRYGPLRWPTTRLPLRRIGHADTTDVRGLSWGYCGSVTVFGAAAVIIGPGPRCA